MAIRATDMMMLMADIVLSHPISYRIVSFRLVSFCLVSYCVVAAGAASMKRQKQNKRNKPTVILTCLLDSLAVALSLHQLDSRQVLCWQ